LLELQETRWNGGIPEMTELFIVLNVISSLAWLGWKVGSTIRRNRIRKRHFDRWLEETGRVRTR
jgi:hypothetical protein